MNDEKLTSALKSVANEDIQIPGELSGATMDLILSPEPSAGKTFPYAVALVFLANMLLSILFGGILFLIRPITLLEWLIIGSVYSTANVFLYIVTFMNYERVKNMFNAYSKGGI
jgi:hypothetical protein